MSARRATDVRGLVESLSGFVSGEGRERALGFRPRADDLIISTYPKCGTTWLQQIVHGLRTGGDMDFDEITAVVPWLELAYDMGIDPHAEQRGAPRAYKSHLCWEEVPKGARYVNAIRDPGDVLVSMYRFFDGWRMEPGAVPIDEFAFDFFLRRDGGRRYWTHVLSWWRQRRRPDVLLLCYEDMRGDLAGTVARIARFAGIDADRARLEVATRQATIEFMRAHERQFDDHLVREARDAACGLPPHGATSKVRSGQVGAHASALGPDVRAALAEAWAREIAPATGHGDYAAMRATLAAEARGTAG